MKLRGLAAAALLSFIAPLAIAAPQPQGEFHKYIVKKTDDERHKTKSKEWWGAGVIVFSKQDIPRLGSKKDVSAQVATDFKADEKFYGRVYLPKALGQLPAGYPPSILYRVYVDGKFARDVELKGEYRPDPDWSSWMIDLPDDLKNVLDSVADGKHQLRVEIWSSDEKGRITIYKDEDTDKVVAVGKDTVNEGKFLAAGDFNYEK